MAIKIGVISLKNNIFLAPMAGVTNMPMRILCKEQGCGLAYTEMVSARGMHYDDRKSFRLAEIHAAEKPAGVQIFGSDPAIMAEIARKLDDSDACLIDINMGCPTPKIVKNGEGCALMRDPALAARIIAAVVKAASKPVTVKMRKGWDEAHVNAVEMARIAENCGARAVTVHGRTRDQFYSGKADWEIIREVKEAVSIPVIGNGDIWSPHDCVRMFAQTGCDAVMIGRGAQGNPWIFSRTAEYLKSGVLPPEPSIEDRIRMIKRHLRMLIELKGEHTGVLEMRKHIAWYIKGIRNAAHMRETIFRLSTESEILTVLDGL